MPEFLRWLGDPLHVFAILGAVIWKLATDAKATWKTMLITAFAAVFCALVFAPAVIEWAEISGKAQAAIYALAALTGEHLMRLVLAIAQDPQRGLALWREFRGGKK